MAVLPFFSQPPAPRSSVRGPGTGARFEPASRTTGIAVALAIHAALLAALWHDSPTRTALLSHAPIVVALLTEPRAEPRPPPPPSARPRPVAKREATSQPTPPSVVAGVPDQAPDTWAIAAPPPEPPAPAAAPLDAAPLTAAPVPTAPPVTVEVVPPRFDAAYLRNPAPAYPAASRRRGEQGRVVLRVLVSANGEARTVEVRTSSGFEALDRTAVETVRQWRFVPARLGATPVDAWVVVPLAFSLTG